jgi:hypothetical protein
MSRRQSIAEAWATIALTGAIAAALSACGGSNPADNPPDVQNPAGLGGQKLSFIYYQKCVQPVFLAPLAINQGGVISVNTCAAAGCHDNATGTGGAFRLLVGAAPIDMTNPANTPDVIRASDMYKNFYSSQGEVVFNAPLQSRLLTKPLLLGVLHGGGLIFTSENDPNARLIRYWISRPMPQGQDEFSSAANSMFESDDPLNGACRTQ